jgi:hypothetical protein
LGRGTRINLIAKIILYRSLINENVWIPYNGNG